MIPRFGVLVTGASGFVGRSIVQTLLEAGHDVVALDRAFDGDLCRRWTDRWSKQLDVIEAETSQLPELAVDSVIHAAALTAGPEETQQTPEAHVRANLDPLLDVLEWAGNHGVLRTLVLSSDAVFRSSEPGPIMEAEPTSPLGLYAVTKTAAENVCETLREHYQRDVIAVRLGNIYGPEEISRQTRPRVSLVQRMVDQSLQQGVLEVHRQSPAQDWTYAPDVGMALLALLAAPALQHHLYNVASEQLFTALDIAHAIQILVPEVKLKIHDGTEPESHAAPRFGYLSSERLRRELGFDQWTPFSEGLRSVIDSHKVELTQ